MTHTSKEMMIAVKAVIDSPDTWTKRSIARDKDGKPLMEVNDSRAVSWCFIGAVEKIANADREWEKFGSLIGIFESANGLRNGMAVPFNNDESTSHADMMAAMDKAIAACP